MNVLSLSLMSCPSVGSSPSPVSPERGGGGGRERGGGEGVTITIHERKCVSVFVAGDMNDVACSCESVNGEEIK